MINPYKALYLLNGILLGFCMTIIAGLIVRLLPDSLLFFGFTGAIVIIVGLILFLIGDERARTLLAVAGFFLVLLIAIGGFLAWM